MRETQVFDASNRLNSDSALLSAPALFLHQTGRGLRLSLKAVLLNAISAKPTWLWPMVSHLGQICFPFFLTPLRI